MRTAILTRVETSNEGTFGELALDNNWKCVTGELPWRDNATGKSCIPPGVYLVEWANSPKHGWCYHVRNVPARSDVEIHSANWMGDAAKGFRCQLLGCIALGAQVATLEGQRAVTISRVTVAELAEQLNRESFELTIVDAVTGAASESVTA